MRRSKAIAAAAVALMGFSCLILTVLKETSLRYMRVGELLNHPSISGRVRVEGDVVEGSVERNGRFAFEITDGRSKLKVIYEGKEIPPNFREGRSVVVEGRYNPEEMIFEAERIMTRCPSRYEGRGR